MFNNKKDKIIMKINNKKDYMYKKCRTYIQAKKLFIS